MKKHWLVGIIALSLLAGGWLLQNQFSQQPEMGTKKPRGQQAKSTLPGAAAGSRSKPELESQKQSPPGKQPALDPVAELQAEILALAVRDLPAARQRLEELPEAQRMPVQQNLAASLVSTAPLEALQLLVDLPPDSLTDSLLRQASMEYSSRDPEAALKWSAAQPEADVRALLLSAVLCDQSTREPDAAFAMALKEFDPGSVQNRLLVEIIPRWTQSAPQAAAASLTHLPASARSDAVEELVSIWAVKDYPAAEQWVKTQTDPSFATPANNAWIRIKQPGQ